MVASARPERTTAMRFVPFLLPIAILLIGCGKPSTSSGSAKPSASAVVDVPVELEEGGEVDPIASPSAKKGGTLTTWAGPYPKSLNMWLDYNSFSKSVSELMFEPLATLHPTKDEPVGILADSWEISPDGKSYTFHINPNAKWSDGKPVTAEDVQFYYDVIMNPKNLTSLFRVGLSRFARPEVIDDHTIRITATEPHWANFWAAAEFCAFPKHVWEGIDFNEQNFSFPVVSGPYELSDVKTNRSIQLKRRGDWWGRARRFNLGKYNFDRLNFIAMEDRNKMLEVLKKGEIDLFPVYTSQVWAEKTNFPQVQKNWVVRQEVENQEPKAFQGFAMNMRKAPFDDVRVRKALAHLLNRELMNEKLMFNLYFLLNSYYPDLYPDNRNPDIPMTEYNPQKARELLAEAGWTVGPDGILAKDGKPFTLTILHYDGSDLRHLNIYLEDLKAVGIQANIELVSRSTFTKRVDHHDFDMIWANWGASRLRDPETMWSSKQADEIASQNFCGVKDPEIDALIEQQKTEMDLGRRNEILRKIDARLMEISPYVLMWQSGANRLLYWNKFGTPEYVLDKFNKDDAAIPYWWFDEEKERALIEAQRENKALPAEPEKVTYQE